MRQLIWMAEAKQTDEWNRSAALMALLANTHRDPKKSRKFKPADFHPHLKQRHPTRNVKPPKVGIAVLKSVFVDGKPLREELP